MVAVIDPLSGVVSMVDTVLTRLETREQKLKERMDVLDALIDLLHVLRAWADAAAHTDAALSSWLKTKRSPEAEMILRGAIKDQYHLRWTLSGGSDRSDKAAKTSHKPANTWVPLGQVCPTCCTPTRPSSRPSSRKCTRSAMRCWRRSRGSGRDF